MTSYRPGAFQQFPPVVKNLLIINGIVFMICQLLDSRGFTYMGNSVDDILALHYWQSPKFRWWQLITHLFMHANVTHIFFNMFALWMFGRILEGLWGPQRFLVFYLVCGLGAAICHLGVLTFEYRDLGNALTNFIHNPNFVDYAQLIRHHGMANNPELAKVLTFWSNNPDCPNCAQIATEYMVNVLNESTVGASGAVFGLLFAFGYLFPNTELLLYFAIPVKAKWFVAGYALIELFSGIRNSAGDNIAHFAHLGGMLFAFILLRIWKNNVRDQFY